MPKTPKKLLFRIGLVLGIMLILILIGYALTQTSWFLNIVRKTVISQTNKQINGNIDIGSLEGNIFKNLTLHHIVLNNEDGDFEKSGLIDLKQLSLSYDLGHLLQKKFIVKSILVSDLTINLHQDDEGTWNLANIVPMKVTENDTIKSDEKKNPWEIDVENIILSNSKVNISGTKLSDQFPREISVSQLISQANLDEGLGWEISEASIEIQPQEIMLSLSDMQGNDQLDISLKELKISSPKSLILLSGDLENQPVRQGNIIFQANPLDFAEVQTWLPTFPLRGNPNLRGELEIQGDSLSSELTLNLDEQKIILQAQLPKVQNPFTSYLDLAWQNINSNSWIDGLPNSRLNGNLIASLQGETWPEVKTQINLKLEESDINSYKINTFRLEGEGSPALFKGNLAARSEFGDLNITTELNDLMGEIGYVISGSLSSFDLLKIIPNLPYQTEINSQFNLDGKGIDPEKLQANIQLDLAGSYFNNQPLEKFNLTADYRKGNYNLKQVQINYDGVDFFAKGQGDIYGRQDLSYQLQLDSLPKIVHELHPGLALKANISGVASGKVKDLATNLKIDLQEVKYQDYQLDSLTGEAILRLSDQMPKVEFTGALTNIEIPTFPLDSIWINAHYTPEKLFLDLNLIQSDTLNLSLTGEVLPLQSQAKFTKLEINAFGQNWQNIPDTLKINFNPDKLFLHNLELSSDTQIIAADFSLDSQENYNLMIKCDSLAIWPLRYLNPELETIKGKLSLNIDGKGELSNPQLSLNWSMDNLSLNNIRLHKIAGSLDYQKNIAKLDLELNRAGQESISLKGYLPFQADVTQKEFNILPDQPLELDLKITPFDLSSLNGYTDDIKEVKGKLDLTAKIENTYSHPLLNAKFLIEDAAFKLPILGIDYRDINLDLEAHNNKIELKRLFLPSGKKGYLKVKGSTILNLKETQLDSLQLTINAKNWQALKNRDMDLKLNSKLKIAGNSNYPTFSGYLNILRARLYLPALLGRERKKVTLTTPLLLARSSTKDLTEDEVPKLKEEPSQVIKNLRGNMKLSFPRNTWIKSKEMNLELGGELEIIKNSPDFVLSGNVMVVRGNYTVYGRRFNISNGNIYFQGKSDLNPEIDLEANYTLRNSSQEKLTLSILISGSLQYPVIQFMLDDKQISEGDGVSYIVFGKSTAELSSGERGQIATAGDDDLATKIVVRQIASQVTRALQNRLNLDVVEFKGDNNWRQAQVIVGKYLTNNLFLSYERELSFGRNNEVVPDKITLEYELRRRIYLQATKGGEKSTGVDLIWKFQD